MLTIIITFLSAISISVIAAGYSIMGLATLFAGAVIPIIAMGSALEVGKLAHGRMLLVCSARLDNGTEAI